MAIIIGLIIGFLLPIQTIMNATLSKKLVSSVLTTLLTFVIGVVPLVILTFIIDKSLFFPLHYFSEFPLWIWSGGILGVIYILNNIALFQRLGTTQTAILPVLGQIFMGLTIDYFGLFGVSVSNKSAYALIGAILVMGGVIGSVILAPKTATQIQSITLSPTKKLIWQFIGILTGAIGAAQTAVNGQLGTRLQSSIKATLVSFVIGILVLLVILCIVRIKPSTLTNTNLKSPYWMWLGGLIGCIFVLGSVYIAPLIGTGLTVITILVGLTVGSLLVEHFGWFNSPKKKTHPYQLVSLVVMIIGVCMIQFMG